MALPSARRARPEDVPAIVTLLRVCLGHGWNEEYYRWKHERSPFGPSLGWVAEAGGEVVALRVFLRWSWLSRGRPLAAFRAVDTAVHPSFRRRGLFSRLTGEALAELSREGGRFVFNTPNRRSLPGYLALGWRRVGRVPLLIYPRRPMRMAAAFIGRGGAGDSAPLTSEDLPRVSTLLDELAGPEWLGSGSAAEADERLHTAWSPEYLRWRYDAVPGHQYRALHDTHRDAGAALIFHRQRRAGLKEVKISELLMRGGDQGGEMAAALLARLVRDLDADYLVAVAAPGTPERRALRRAGFLPARVMGPRLVVRELAPAAVAPDPTAATAWRCSLGDLELF